MSDWQVGDLAVCVDAGPCRCEPDCKTPLTGLEVGRIYRVTAIRSVCWAGAPWVNLDIGLPPTPQHDPLETGANVERFRKIRPCEEEFTKLVRRKSAPSPREREKRILEALFNSTGTPRSANNGAELNDE